MISVESSERSGASGRETVARETTRSDGPSHQSPPTRAGLPMGEAFSPRTTSVNVHIITSMDESGRVGDRSVLLALGWLPGSAVSVSADPRAGMIVVRPGGQQRLTHVGHLRLLSHVRHACHLAPADRLLLVGMPARQVLVAYTMPALDVMIASYHRADLDGATP
jgi:hypothetical protein